MQGRIDLNRRRSRSQGLAFVGALLLAIAASVTSVSSPAEASTQALYVVDPNGSGTACSVAMPCTLSTAQAAARSAAPTMTGDLVVQLNDGTYPLSSTWVLNVSDGGTDGHNVIYRAAWGAHPVLSGASKITGWSQVPGSSIWSASLPAAFSGSLTRQIYVNGVRAVVDSEALSSVFGTVTATKSGNRITGFTFTAPGPNTWPNPGDADVVYGPGAINGYHWIYAMCPVQSIVNGLLTQQPDCSNSVGSGYSTSLPWAVENSYALLGTPGQFSVDRTTNTIYYVPRPGEDMTTATVLAGLPATQKLVDVNGAQNLQFVGLGFEYSTWTLGGSGLIDQQANVLSNPSTGSQRTPDTILPANVACHACQGVSFLGDTFAHLGGSGLSFDGAGSTNVVTGNVFTDISGNGLQLGQPGVYDTSWNFVPPTNLESGYTVSNNEVFNVANEYIGGVGILATWVKNTTIAHNEVWDVPYTGISLGWGWGSLSGSTGMVNNHIDYNRVHDVMTSELMDGGAIYLNGIQDAAGSVTGNYVYNQSQVYSALYLDNGASNWTVSNNVVSGAVPSWLLVQGYSPTANNNTVTSNYVASTAGGIHDSGNSSNVISGNTTALTSWPSAAQSIINASGVDSAYIVNSGSTPTTDIALGKTATASTSWNGFPPSGANDDQSGNPWASASGDTSPAWEVDLGEGYPLSKIQVQFREDGYDHPTTRENIEVRVSNNADMSNHAVVCSVGPVPMMYENTFNCAPPGGSWRYVAVVKTDNVAMVLNEVRVFGQPQYAINTNLALYGSAGSRSSYGSQYGAAMAIDGSTATLFESSAASSSEWWQVSLPSSKALTQIQIVFRQDGVDQPGTRENFQVWVSTYGNMDWGHTVACSVGATPLALGSTYACTPPPGPWQYVAVVKSDNDQLAFAEVQVLGH